MNVDMALGVPRRSVAVGVGILVDVGVHGDAGDCCRCRCSELDAAVDADVGGAWHDVWKCVDVVLVGVAVYLGIAVHVNVDADVGVHAYAQQDARLYAHLHASTSA